MSTEPSPADSLLNMSLDNLCPLAVVVFKVEKVLHTQLHNQSATGWFSQISDRISLQNIFEQ